MKAVPLCPSSTFKWHKLEIRRSMTVSTRQTVAHGTPPCFTDTSSLDNFDQVALIVVHGPGQGQGQIKNRHASLVKLHAMLTAWPARRGRSAKFRSQFRILRSGFGRTNLVRTAVHVHVHVLKCTAVHVHARPYCKAYGTNFSPERCTSEPFLIYIYTRIHDI